MGNSIPASMIGNATTKAFLALLPVTLTLDDYNGTEKIVYLTKKAEASEVFTQLAFYAGWPNVFSALPTAKEVFDKRG